MNENTTEIDDVETAKAIEYALKTGLKEVFNTMREYSTFQQHLKTRYHAIAQELRSHLQEHGEHHQQFGASLIYVYNESRLVEDGRKDVEETRMRA